MKQPKENTFIVGNNPMTMTFFGVRNTFQTFLDHYGEFDGEKFYGTYGIGFTPVPAIVIRDLDLIKQICGEETNL